mmetsp:Transcript_9604/g.15722  ORF Transcript_9604/g.15722 Transcript_9604/m.15722 type:complete len:88 (+) Transcript_9604:186-449(+)
MPEIPSASGVMGVSVLLRVEILPRATRCFLAVDDPHSYGPSITQHHLSSYPVTVIIFVLILSAHSIPSTAALRIAHHPSSVIDSCIN